MPELPEVEVLVRHLAPLLAGKKVRAAEVRRLKVVAPTPVSELEKCLVGATFKEVSRRGKYLVFTLRKPGAEKSFQLIGHLGMTGRMYLQPAKNPPPKHTAVALDLGGRVFIYEDQRYFGRLNLAAEALARLGPEPLGMDFTVDYFARELKKSRQAIKVKLLDQSLVAGIGNIYASEALFRAKISPKARANRLRLAQVQKLHAAIRKILAEAIKCGSTIPLSFDGENRRGAIFYYGTMAGAEDFYAERLRVYDRRGKGCWRCGMTVRRIVQQGRSTFYCPGCQRSL